MDFYNDTKLMRSRWVSAEISRNVLELSSISLIAVVMVYDDSFTTIYLKKDS